MTDKYKDRHHHLVVDTIYAVITFVLIATNVGLGYWYYLYFVPADLELQVVSTSVVTSGEAMHLNVIYSNPSRDLKDVSLDIYLPEGYIPSGEQDKRQVVHFELGEIEAGTSGSATVSGVVFGDIGQSYDVRVVSQYSSVGRVFYEAAAHEFTVDDSSFRLALELPKAVVYDEPVEGTLVVANTSVVDRKNITLGFSAPSDFAVVGIAAGESEAVFNVFTQEISIPVVAANTELRIPVTGFFGEPRGEAVVAGDLQTEVRVSGTSGVASPLVDPDRQFDDGGHSNRVQLILPRVFASVSMPEAVNFGSPLVSTITVRNDGNQEMQNVQLNATPIGAALTPSAAYASLTQGGVRGEISARPYEAGVLQLPVIDSLAVGETVTIQLVIPTVVLDRQNVSASVRVEGTVYAPAVEETIAVPAASSSTRFNSRVSMSAAAIYTTDAGEQLGYGPNPPQAWEVTSYRVVLSLRNINNMISGTTVTTALPSQVEWTGSYSVSAGTKLTYDAASHSVSWVIPALPPQSLAYGAQFEVWFTPNHLQIGEVPNVTLSTTATTTDAFSGGFIYTAIDGVKAPAAVVE